MDVLDEPQYERSSGMSRFRVDDVDCLEQLNVQVSVREMILGPERSTYLAFHAEGTFFDAGCLNMHLKTQIQYGCSQNISGMYTHRFAFSETTDLPF